MKTNFLTIFILCASLVSGGLMQSASGHSGATGIVKERMDNMVLMGKALGAVADMLKGKRPYDATVVSHTGDVIIKHSKELGSLFPDTKAGRGGKHTAALPTVWDKNDDFLALAKSLEEKAGVLQAVAANGEMKKVKMAFGQTAKICSACHADFRKKKE